MGKYNKIDIALGLKPNISTVYKYGAGKVGTSFSPIWDNGGAYNWITTATKLQVVSSDTDDVNGGAGAWTIKIYGLDENWNEISETIELDGTSAVETANTYIRCYRAIIMSGGTRIGLAGDITIYETGSPSKIVASVLEEKNQTHMAIYTIPANKTALIANADANAGKGKEAEVELLIKENIIGDEVDLVKATRYIYQNSFSRVYNSPRKLKEKTDIWVRGKSALGPVNLSASFEICLFDI